MRLLLALLSVAAIGFPQSPETFEVASIKPSDPMAPGTMIQFEPGGGVKIEGASLKTLVQFTYDLRDFQVSGATGWISSERYNILAKGAITDGPPDLRRRNDAQRKDFTALVRKRMRALLAERFRLTVHPETKSLPIYALVVAKNGPKMQPNNSPDGSPQGMTIGRAMYKGMRAAPDGIAEGLAEIVGRPVRNETGLQGYYDFKMEWTPDAAPPAPGSEQEKLPETIGPSIFTALQEQLGLKLESKRGPVEVIVIDRAERPSEN